MAKKNSASLRVGSLKHNDKRTNIPTEELRDFVIEEEASPKTRLYPRDPSLDPQLVWKGKDEQDSEDLAVPVVPIYIQEKIHPQAIIDSLPRMRKTDSNQANLFEDFNGGPTDFEQKIDFYHHEQNWTNRLILGDSLMVMTSLAEKEGLKGKVQAIYIDPPYGIKFNSNWQVSTRKRDVKDRAEDATRQPEQVRAFRDTWNLGIHSYLAYLRDRLVVARELLTETGSVFVQMGDENVHLARCLMDEVFGSENFVALIPFITTTARGGSYIDSIFDYLIWYGKSKECLKFRQLFIQKQDTGNNIGQYDFVELENGKVEKIQNAPKEQIASSPFAHSDTTSQGESASGSFEVSFNHQKYSPPNNRHWSTTSEGMQRLILAGRIFPIGSRLRYKRFLEDYSVFQLTNSWIDTSFSGFGEDKKYVVQTLPLIIQRCLLMTTDPGDLVLDPTCGSGTTAYVAEQWGRRWITCDTSRVALALTRTRLMSASYPYYLLSDSPEGVSKEGELTGEIPPDIKTGNDIKKGFVYKRVPHVTLKSIANNPDIREGMSREEIDAAIARHAETENLFDHPYEDNKRVRVCGPFSVESLSPHRVLSIADDDEDGSVTEQKGQNYQDFVVMILENLKKAGVQNTRKNERLVFDRLEPCAGKWIHAAGEFSEAEGAVRRVAVSIGPEHGTVGPQQVKEAAKEAVQGVGFDVLVICGFAFDPHVSEEAKRYGSLTVLPAKMNPDLSMGDELLKKTGAGNLFMVFGEPDVEITKNKDGQLVAEIRGVDVYDPSTGQIRNASTNDIACWFIDTSYNDESFFVRHAYFTGADEPYDKLKRALRSEIDEDAWRRLYRTISLPFPVPETGKIAVKVINHYGDEVLKVFEVEL